MIMTKFSAIDEALNFQSYIWLEENETDLFNAVRQAANNGARPDEIRRHVTAYTQRPALARRLEQAAAYHLSIAPLGE